jgi:hypothetical protein
MPGLAGEAGPAAASPSSSSLLQPKKRAWKGSHADAASASAGGGGGGGGGRKDNDFDDDDDDDDNDGMLVDNVAGAGAAARRPMSSAESSSPDEIIMCFHVGKGFTACAAYYVVAEVGCVGGWCQQFDVDCADSRGVHDPHTHSTTEWHDPSLTHHTRCRWCAAHSAHH